MLSNTILNNIDHADLCVREIYAEAFGNMVSSSLVFPNEFVEAQKEYPLLFRRAPEDGSWQAIAIMGLNEGNNLFIEDKVWRGKYVPAIQARGPFSIGIQQINGEEKSVIHVDLKDQRLSQSEGHRLFTDNGENTPYLNQISKTLAIIDEGRKMYAPMFKLLEDLKLLESVNVEIETARGSKTTFQNYFTIDQKRLITLSGDDLYTLQQSGCLAMCYYVCASLTNFQVLIQLQNHQDQRTRSAE